MMNMIQIYINVGLIYPSKMNVDFINLKLLKKFIFILMMEFKITFEVIYLDIISLISLRITSPTSHQALIHEADSFLSEAASRKDSLASG